VADETKEAKVLGENNQLVPVEVMQFAVPLAMRKIEEYDGRPMIRTGTKKVGPVITDNGNVIIDASFGPILKPMELERHLKGLPGVVETGLFIKMADVVYVGGRSGVKKLVKE
jgi:ribose 5-phosphate isomerase A